MWPLFQFAYQGNCGTSGNRTSVLWIFSPTRAPATPRFQLFCIYFSSIFVGREGLEPPVSNESGFTVRAATNYRLPPQYKKSKVCCYAKVSLCVLPKIRFITPPYCQLMRNNGGLLPNLKRQTKLEVCHVVEYSLTAHHSLLFISNEHIALIGHFLHHSLKDSCFQAYLPLIKNLKNIKITEIT